MSIQALAPEEILAAIYRHPVNEGDTTVYQMPEVLGVTGIGQTKFRIESVNRMVDEVLFIQYRPIQQDYVIAESELIY